VSGYCIGRGVQKVMCVDLFRGGTHKVGKVRCMTPLSRDSVSYTYIHAERSKSRRCRHAIQIRCGDLFAPPSAASETFQSRREVPYVQLQLQN
jgi:hypothetical protein